MQLDCDTDRPAPPRRRERGPRRHLAAALLALADGRGEILSHSEKPWSSITFSGTRHSLTLQFVSHEAMEAGERFITALPDHEFTIPGQLVAEATIASVDHRTQPDALMTVTAELLLLDEC